MLKDLILKFIRKSRWPQIASEAACLSDVKAYFRATARAVGDEYREMHRAEVDQGSVYTHKMWSDSSDSTRRQ